MFRKRLALLTLLLCPLPGTLLRAFAQTAVPAENSNPDTPEPLTATAPAADFWATDLGQGSAQRGKASWYGLRFHGRRTASGEIFKNTELTAAHRTLPLFSYAKVTLLSTGKSVVVRINDRGPHILTHRIIDLSHAAANQLGLLAQGIGDVLVERVVARNADDPPPLRLPLL